jgi:hypothetical protein
LVIGTSTINVLWPTNCAATKIVAWHSESTKVLLRLSFRLWSDQIIGWQFRGDKVSLRLSLNYCEATKLSPRSSEAQICRSYWA